uniref:Uncharacterized protein n=1 Tax=Romanomermis culicivorax TaxID=13658 RepID=A0A915ISC7_ROMCU
MDVVPAEPATMLPPRMPAVDPRIYLATPAILPSPPIIATVATARYSGPVHFSQHIISDHQWQALATALTAYHFPSLPPGMLFPEHHWMDYPEALTEEIQHILLLQLTTVPVPQIAQPAPVIAQAAVQPPTTLPWPPPIAAQRGNPETFGSFEESPETGVQSSASTAYSPNGCGTSHVSFHIPTAYSHVTAIHSPDVRHNNYHNTHHITAAYGLDVVLGAAPRTDTMQRFKPRLPSEATSLPN